MNYSTIKKLICFIYNVEEDNKVVSSIMAMLKKKAAKIKMPEWFSSLSPSERELPLDHKDSVLITYGDQFSGKEEMPLKVLKKFIKQYIGNSISTIHILPFYPYSSDDGFSVIDYKAVDPKLGTWKDVASIGKSHKLMADLVLNHCSAKSVWFKKFLKWDKKYKDFFITADPNTDLSMVFRPRALPLLTPYDTADGKKFVWTTFSADQVDLNFANPEVLKEMLSIFLFYIKNGVSIVRLDAIAYLWKETGHTCLHHEKTHAVVKLFREVVKIFTPWVIIITETNVPHKENLSYFGNGNDEAQMVYQFALPPLVLDAHIREDANHLRNWASDLKNFSDTTTFFNFLSSHDGIGVLPSRGILSSEEIENMISAVKDRGGRISYKAVKDGQVPYEMNINYRSAITGNLQKKDLHKKDAINKFIASQAIMIALQGVPGIYVHSIIGSLNYSKGVEITKANRTINREKFDYKTVKKELDDKKSSRTIILSKFKRLLDVKRKEKAFHPQSEQIILPGSDNLFAFLKIPKGIKSKKKCSISFGAVLCIYNMSGKILKYSPEWKNFDLSGSAKFKDIITGKKSSAFAVSDGSIKITLQPWEFAWIKI
ncbi:MAG: sugar phosphorylase [Spirochaetaceae bacterium]|nr:sugar phosphorylase [Spirochaetaceae bacterium]